MRKTPAIERFWPKVQKQDDGCWVWTAAHKRYGQFNADGGTGRPTAGPTSTSSARSQMAWN